MDLADRHHWPLAEVFALSRAEIKLRLAFDKVKAEMIEKANER